MTPGDKTPHKNPWEERHQSSNSWGVIIASLIGAYAVVRLHRTGYWFYFQRNRSQSSRRNATSDSYTGSYKEEACKYYNRRMQEEYEDELERLERIRRMQSVFNRERNKRNKSSESWREHSHDAYQYQHFERNDWYWHTDTSYKDQRANFRPNPRESGNFKMSHHYSVLGLDRSRAKPYSEVEIKSAFRAKAKEYHPDQNQNNKESAEAKFKEVMTSYEAIKSERKNNGC